MRARRSYGAQTRRKRRSDRPEPAADTATLGAEQDRDEQREVDRLRRRDQREVARQRIDERDLADREQQDREQRRRARRGRRPRSRTASG